MGNTGPQDIPAGGGGGLIDNIASAGATVAVVDGSGPDTNLEVSTALQTLIAGAVQGTSLFPLPGIDAGGHVAALGLQPTGVTATDTANLQAYLNACLAAGGIPAYISVNQAAGVENFAIGIGSCQSKISIALGATPGGSFTITVPTVGTTGAVAYNATAANVLAALVAIGCSATTTVVTQSTAHTLGVATAINTFITVQGIGVGAPTITTAGLTGTATGTAASSQGGVVTQVGIWGDGTVGIEAANAAAIPGAPLDMPLGTPLTNLVFRDFALDGNLANNGAWSAFTPRYTIKCRFQDLIFRAGTRNTIIEGDINAFSSSAGNEWVGLANSGASDTTGGYSFLWKQFTTDSMTLLGNGGGKEMGIYMTGGDHKFWNTHPVEENPNGLCCFVVGPHAGANAGPSGMELFGVVPDTVTMVQHTGATGVNGLAEIVDPRITTMHQGLLIDDAVYADILPPGTFVGPVTATTFGVPGGSFIPVDDTGTAVPLAAGGSLAGITLHGVGINVQAGSALLPTRCNVVGGESISPGAVPSCSWNATGAPTSIVVTPSSLRFLYPGMDVNEVIFSTRGAWAAAGAPTSITVTPVLMTGIQVGMKATDTTTPANIPAGTTVTAVNVGAGTITLTNGAGFPTAAPTRDQLSFVFGFIPVGTKLSVVGATTITLTNAAGFPTAAPAGDVLNFSGVYGIAAGPNTTVNVTDFQLQSNNGQPYTSAFTGVTTNINYSGLLGQQTAVNAIPASTPALPPAATTASPANPTGTVSTAQVMAGLAVQFTPQSTGKMVIRITGAGGTQTAAVNFSVSGHYGTGTPPVNGAAVTGNAFPQGQLTPLRPPAATGPVVPFELVGLIDGNPNALLNVGTQYWLDIAFSTTNAADEAILQNLSVVVQECS